jgi:hypothetical protein
VYMHDFALLNSLLLCSVVDLGQEWKRANRGGRAKRKLDGPGAREETLLLALCPINRSAVNISVSSRAHTYNYCIMYYSSRTNTWGPVSVLYNIAVFSLLL